LGYGACPIENIFYEVRKLSSRKLSSRKLSSRKLEGLKLKIKRFEDILAWQKARELSVEIYNIFSDS